ncbi:MAG: hypothetical protein Q7S22_00370 [Candidatus Micrarchaeota archaeon]|nr:hypothetical protein [Candidatus Micrarchaeota archaeon]
MGRKHRVIRASTPVRRLKLAEPLVDYPEHRIKYYKNLLERGKFNKILNNLRKCSDDVKYIIRCINGVKTVITVNARRVLVTRLKNKETKDFTISQFLKYMRAPATSSFSNHDHIVDVFADAARQGVDISKAIPDLVDRWKMVMSVPIKEALEEALKNPQSAKFTAVNLFHLEIYDSMEVTVLIRSLQAFQVVLASAVAENVEVADVIVTEISKLMDSRWFELEQARNSVIYTDALIEISTILGSIRDAQNSQEEKVA